MTKKIEKIVEREFRAAAARCQKSGWTKNMDYPAIAIAVANAVVEECAKVCDGLSTWRDWRYMEPRVVEGSGVEHADAACVIAKKIRALASEKGRNS